MIWHIVYDSIEYNGVTVHLLQINVSVFCLVFLSCPNK